MIQLATTDPSRARGLNLALKVLELAHAALWEDPSTVGLSTPRSSVPFTVQVALRVHQLREARLEGGACLWELHFNRPWFVLASRAQALLLLFSASGALWLAGKLTAHGIAWEDPDSRNWF